MRRPLRACVLPKFGATTLIGTALMLLSACQTPNLTLNRTSPAEVLVAPLRQPVQPVPVGGMVEVRENDTLFDVATRYNVTPQSIIEANGLSPPYELRRGKVLKITPQRTHIVRHGDSVYVISQRYAVSQYQLAQLNGLSPPFQLEVGQRLQLPNTLDFSVLDSGLPDGVSGTAISQPAPVPEKTASASSSRKRFVAPKLGTSGGFTWPVAGEIVAEFGPSQRGVHNDGVNIAAKQGVTVGAAAKGRVAFVGTNIKSFGRLILIKHDAGIITAYAHLGDITVKEGDIVTLGQAIGSIGKSGRVETPQLHFEIRKLRQPVDPRSIIS